MKTFTERRDRELIELQMLNIKKSDDNRRAAGSILEALRFMVMTGFEEGQLGGFETYNAYIKAALDELDVIDVK